MAEPVEWRADGVPYSPRYGDIYHSESGAAAQARHVFLGGCNLPAAWANAVQWRILETGFGFGINFLTTWRAWRDDAARPALLHFVSVEAHPVSAADLRRAAAQLPDLAELAEALASQWSGLLPGVHRLAFDAGRVVLTLCIGDVQPMLRGSRRFDADSIYLDGFGPDRNPEMWSAHTLKAVTRFARVGTRVATWTIARAVRDALTQLGFQVHKAPGHPPKRDCLRGEFAPAWTPRRRATPGDADAVRSPGACTIVGAGLAGAAVAAQLALRGWQVTVLDAATHAAAGASGLPAGLLAPHVSPDDALLSRLTRAGIRATWQQLERLLANGDDWRATGVLERRAADALRLPGGWTPDGPNESWPATARQIDAAGLPPGTTALWHARGGWVKPARLVKAWLQTPGVRFVGGSPVGSLVRDGTQWQVRDAQGKTLAHADRVVVAAGFASSEFAPALPLTAVRGQVVWGRAGDTNALPPIPVNGDGHLLAHVPSDDGDVWLAGATFDRDDADATPRAADTQANRERLARLHPAASDALAPAFDRAEVCSWTGVRCASTDRRPLVGPVDERQAPGLWVCTAMGSRGLTFATLCAELLAARWHAEPLPVSAALANAVDVRRGR